MSSIRDKNTKPEIIIRKSLWENGMRHRIHNKNIIETPDSSNAKQKLTIFIIGVFDMATKDVTKNQKQT